MNSEPWGSKFRRIDFLGAICLGFANCSLLLFLDQLRGGSDAIQSATSIFLLSLWMVFMLVFAMVEGFLAREPILPLRLLSERNVFSAYAIQFLQGAAQVSVWLQRN